MVFKTGSDRTVRSDLINHELEIVQFWELWLISYFVLFLFGQSFRQYWLKFQQYFELFKIWNQMKGKQNTEKKKQRKKKSNKEEEESTNEELNPHSKQPSACRRSPKRTPSYYFSSSSSSSLFRPHLHMTNFSFAYVFCFLWYWFLVLWTLALEMTKDSGKLKVGVKGVTVICHFNFESLPTWVYIVFSPFLFVVLFFFFFSLFLGSYYNYNILKNVVIIIIIIE